MYNLGKGLEILNLLLPQLSKDMREAIAPLLFEALASHISETEFMYPDLTWKELCGLITAISTVSAGGKGQLERLVEAIMRGARRQDGCRHVMTTFTIQPYTKKELALLYFPSATPHVAVNHLMSWIRRCKPIHDALVDQGYRKTTMWLSPCEVRLITEYLGEP